MRQLWILRRGWPLPNTTDHVVRAERKLTKAPAGIGALTQAKPAFKANLTLSKEAVSRGKRMSAYPPAVVRSGPSAFGQSPKWSA